MFESLVANVLNRYLGKYVEGLNQDQLRVAVWRGELFFFRLLGTAADSWTLSVVLTMDGALLGTVGPRSGDVQLEGLRLRKGALQRLHFPMEVRGRYGEIGLKVVLLLLRPAVPIYHRGIHGKAIREDPVV